MQISDFSMAELSEIVEALRDRGDIGLAYIFEREWKAKSEKVQKENPWMEDFR